MEEDFKVLDYISHPAMLEQLAEECCELGHAALKLSRVLREENPTPVTVEEAEKAFMEEVVDVDMCISELDMTVLTMSMNEAKKFYNDTHDRKMKRWEERLRTKKKD